MTTVPLSKMVQANGEDISALELQEPSFEQIQKLGLPVSVDASGHFTVNAAVAIKYLPELAGVPPSTLKSLGPYDLNNLCWAIWRFFIMAPTT
ncbi:MAG: phage tail assembly protein [Leclercia adecarboxylata]|nr:phage tail assembly protein [Leclercia adecarboxylata]MDU1082770.1 phage tail assembly protein [Leclercia adecarboxylata]